MKDWIKKNKKELVFFVYMIITLFILVIHKSFRDEAQAWLLAKNCTIPELLDRLKFEGHFALWYIITMPFAKLGLSYSAANLISWGICTVGTWIFFDKAPFKFYKKVLLLFTSPLLYLFPLLFRCYCLIPLAVVLMCVFYKDRKEKPFRYLLSIVLLLNTHVLMLGLVGLSFLNYFIELIKDWKSSSKNEIKNRVISLVIAGALCLISVLPLFGCFSANKEINTNYEIDFSQKIVELIVQPFNIIAMGFIGTNEVQAVYFVVIIIAVILLLFEVKNHPWDYLQMFLCIMWQAIVYTFIMPCSYQKAVTILFVFIFYKWISVYKENANSKVSHKPLIDKLFVTLAILNIICCVLFIINTFAQDYNLSQAYDMGDYINHNTPSNSVILCGPHTEFVSSVIPYVSGDARFYHTTTGKELSYTSFDDENKIKLKEEDILKLKDLYDENDSIYYLYCNGKKDFSENIAESDEIELINEFIEKGIFKEIYTTEKKAYTFETYTLYKVSL